MTQAMRTGIALLSPVLAGLFLLTAADIAAPMRAETSAVDSKSKVIKIPRSGESAVGGEVQAETPAETGQEAAPKSEVKRIVIPQSGTAAESPSPSSTEPAETTTKSEPAQPSQSSFPPRIKKIITHREGKKPEERTLPDVGGTDPLAKRPEFHFDESGGKLDMVLVHGGPPLHGRVIKLTGGLLQFSDQDQRTVPLQRRDLVMLSFTIGQIGALPQLPDDPDEVDPEDDLVITYDGKSVSAKVSAITEESVITNKTTFPRGRVNRILFAGERPDGSAQAKAKDKQKKKNGDNGTVETPGSDRTVEGPAAAATSRPLGTPVKACPKGEPLGGWLTARFENRDPMTVSSQVRLRVHFPLVYHSIVPGHSATWNDALIHDFEAPWMYYDLRMTNTAQTPGTKWDSCTISDDQISGQTDLQVGWDTATFGNSGSVSFDPLKPELNIFFPDEVRVNQPYECKETDPRGGSGSSGRHGVSFHRLNIDPPRPDLALLLPGNFGDPFSGNWIRGGGNLSFGLSVPGTKCHRAQGPLGQECVTHPDHYAVIPFVGDFTAIGDAGERYVQSAPVRFGICCGCGKVPDEQEYADEDETDCLKSARTQGKVFDAEFNSLELALEQAYGELTSAMNLKRAHQNSWLTAMTMCGLDDMSMTILEGISASSGSFKWSPGDLFSVSPKYAKIPGRPRKVVLNWKVLEHFVEGYNLFKQGPQSVLLRSKLARCRASKAYAVSSLFQSRQDWEDVYDDAKAFLDQHDRVARLATENGRLMSDLIQLDIERFSKMADLQARCMDCSEEQGTDPKLCDSLNRDLQFASE